MELDAGGWRPADKPRAAEGADASTNIAALGLAVASLFESWSAEASAALHFHLPHKVKEDL